MAALTIYCKRCNVGYASVGEIPPVCPAWDQETTWTTFAPPAVPRVRWNLTVNDRRFLRSIRITSADDALRA